MKTGKFESTWYSSKLFARRASDDLVALVSSQSEGCCATHKVVGPSREVFFPRAAGYVLKLSGYIAQMQGQGHHVPSSEKQIHYTKYSESLLTSIS